MTMRKVAAITGDGKFTLVEEEVPVLRKGEVLVEVKASLISPGTELGGVPEKRRNPDPKAKPQKFGYANSGVVIKQGEGCEDINIGTKVACMGAGYALHSNYTVIPRNLLIPMPEGMNFEQATFTHLASTAMQAFRRGGVVIGENYAVLGLGILGQFSVQIGAAAGAHVMAIDRLPMRLELAKKGGAEMAVDGKNEDPIEKAKQFTHGFGMDCCLIAFGGDCTAALAQISKMMKTAPDTHQMGRIVIVGGASFQAKDWPIAMGNVDIRPSCRTGAGYHDDAWEHGSGYPPVFVQWTSRRHMLEVTRMQQKGKLNYDMLITHRMHIDKFAEGAEKLVTSPNESLGVVLTY